MFRITLLFIVLFLSGCSKNSQEAEVRRSFNSFLEAKTDDEIRASIVVPKGLNPSSGNRLVKECRFFKDFFKTPPLIQSVEIRGRWARADLDAEPAGTSLMALNLDGHWQVYWDPAGVLIWGFQGNSLSGLSKSDWDDYHAIEPTKGKHVAPSDGDKTSN